MHSPVTVHITKVSTNTWKMPRQPSSSGERPSTPLGKGGAAQPGLVGEHPPGDPRCAGPAGPPPRRRPPRL